MSNPTTTGEWTADTIGSLMDGQIGLQAIADAHNAALADERDEYEVLAWSLGVRKDQPKILQQLRKQLAAETRLLDWAISNPEQFNDINMADASERRHVAIKRVRAALAKIGEK